MSQPTVAWDQLKPYLNAFRTHGLLWVIPTVAMTLLSLVYAAMMPRLWRANQAVHVRAEAIGNQHNQGEFESIDRMKVFQETILEVARSHAVVSSALRRLGPPAGHAADNPWPTPQAVEAMQGVIGISAPKGSEFGRTEIFFLSVVGKTPREAVVRTQILYDELEKHLGELRDAKARSIIRELEKSLQMAQSNLSEATERLEAVEREVGQDLGELRVMNEHGAGDSNLRTSLSQIQSELRQAESSRESLLQLRTLLLTATENSDQLLATPSRLLDSQPALRRLKDGLVDAQLACAALRGKLTEEHPTLRSALRTAAAIRDDLNNEVVIALKGVDADLRSNEAQIAQMHRQQSVLQGRLDQLAGLRARYSNLVADVKHRAEIVDGVRRDLTNAQASSGAAIAASLLIRFHEPVVGDRPIGPGKKSVVLAGMGGGFALGAGLVFLFMPIGPNGTTRRWNDFVNVGRRATDRLFGRRAEDRTSMASGRPPAANTPSSGKPAARRASDPPSPTPPARPASQPTAQQPFPIPRQLVSAARQPPRERRQVTNRREQDQTPT